jgi:hypothetical protein
MSDDLVLQFNSATHFRILDGVPYAIWSYALSFPPVPSRPPTWPGPSFLGEVGGSGVRAGLEFSHRVNIRDPDKFPDVAQIQATKLDRPEAGDVQVVYQVFDSVPPDPIVFNFIAPQELDTFCPVTVKLAQEIADETGQHEARRSAVGRVPFQDFH